MSVERSALNVERSGAPAGAERSALGADNPWPGLASFTEDQRAYFHGRDEEIIDLTQFAERRPLVVLFGQSGLGKSSLLQAGVFPRLRTDGFCPIYIRLDHGDGAPALSEQIKEMVRMETARFGTWTKPGAARPGETLWEFFHHRDDRLLDRDGLGVMPVLVLDQFEELFTLGEARGERRERALAFIRELAELVENRPPPKLVERLDASPEEMEAFDFARTDYRVILSLREDFLPDLESLKTIMPALMQKRMRLARMNGRQALAAVLGPGAGLVGADVGRAIVEFVAGARGGSAERLEEVHVEPALLSVVCHELNERRRAHGQAKITIEQVSGDRREILTDFYERSVADLPDAMRTFVEDHLLTKSGYRDNLALETALEFPGVTRPLVDTLVARRLLRIEDRLGVQRVELTHDVLAEVIRASRDARQQRMALEQARERERRTHRRHRMIIAGLGAAVVALLIGAFFGIRAQRRAEQAARDEAAQSSRTDFVFGSRLLEDGKTSEGLAHLVRAAQSDRTNHLIAPRLLSALAYRSFAEPVGTPIVSPTRLRRAVYLNDGRRLMTWSSDDIRRCWDLETGRLLREFNAGPTHSFGLEGVSPDGRLLATRSGKDVSLWEIDTGRRLIGPLTDEQESWVAVLTPDSRWLVTGGRSRIRISDASTGQLKTTVDHQATIDDFAISQDGTRLVTSGGPTIRVWQIPGGELIPHTSSPPGAFRVGLSPDGKIIAAARATGAQLYHTETGESVGGPMYMGGSSAIADFSHDGKKLITYSTDSSARLYEVPSGKLLAELPHGSNVTTAKFTKEDRYLVTRSGDGVARVWEVQTGRLALEPIRAGDIRGIDVHPNGEEMITVSRDGTLRRWRLIPSAIQSIPTRAQSDRLALQRSQSPGATTASAIYPDRLEKIDLLTGSTLGAARTFPVRISAGLISDDEKLMVVFTEARVAELWTLPAPETSRRQLADFNGIGTSRFSSDSRYLARSNAGTGLHVWDTQSGERIIGPISGLVVLAARMANPFSSNNRYLVAFATGKGAIQVVDLKTRSVGQLLPHPITTSNIAFSPDERRIATMPDPFEGVQVWDIETGTRVGEPFLVRNLARGVIFRRDGRELLNWTRSETNRWDLGSGALLTEPLTGGNDLELRLAPDETRLATFAGDTGLVRIYDVPSGALTGEPMRAAPRTQGPNGSEPDIYRYSGFSADGRFFIAAAPGRGAEAWPVPPAASDSSPGWLLTLATAVAGGEIDQRGHLIRRTFNAGVFDDLRRELAGLPANAPYVEWGRWLLADRATRPIGPGLKITAAELEKQRAGEPNAPAAGETGSSPP